MKPTENHNTDHWEQLSKGKLSQKKIGQYPAFLSLLLSDKKLLEAHPVEQALKHVKKPGIVFRYNFLKIAALFVFGFYIIQQVQNKAQVLTVDSGDFQKQLVLDDGSVIRLNAHSKLQYPSTFSKEERRVTLLEGEAFFDVQHRDGKPFVVALENDNELNVIGTQFNVKIGEDTIHTYLKEGALRWEANSEAHLLQPNELIVQHKQGARRLNWKKQTLSKKARLAVLDWYQKPFVFEQIPLAQMLEVLANFYQAKIVLGDTLKAHEAFTGTFERTESLEEILELVATASNYQLSKKKNTWYLD